MQAFNTQSMQHMHWEKRKIILYLTGIFATHLRSSTQHVSSDLPPVVISAVGHYSHVHSTQHRREVVTIDLCHTPAAHCADVHKKFRSVFIRQFYRLDIGIQLCRLTQLWHKPKLGQHSVHMLTNGIVLAVISGPYSTAYLDEHDVVVECLVVIVVDKYLWDIKDLFKSFCCLQVVFT